MKNIPDEYELEILEESWKWLQDDNLSFALKLEKQVRAGKTPEQLARIFLSVAGEHRGPRAKRIENAARFLEATSK